jgi:hypothetical protein
MRRQSNSNPPCSEQLSINIQPRGLRAPAAGAYLGCTIFHIEELMRSGDLPFRIVGGARVVSVEDLNKIFDALPKQSGALPGRGRHLKLKAVAA